MPGLRLCSVWKLSLLQDITRRHAAKCPSVGPCPAIAFPVSQARISHRSFLTWTVKTEQALHYLRQGQKKSTPVVGGNARTFYSESPSGLKSMDTPADGYLMSGPKASLLKEVAQALGSPLGTGPQAPGQKPLVLVISGPSGVGKDAVINRLKEIRDEIHFVVTATTRAKRPGEVDGKDYFFLSKPEFESMIQKKELLEHAIVYGDYKGIPKKQVRECLARGSDVVLRVDVQGAATVRSILGSSAVFIFLVAESEAALVSRLIERKTETKEKLLLRIATAREELKRMREFDYVVVNADGQLENTVTLISHIIDAEKSRVHQREAKL